MAMKKTYLSPAESVKELSLGKSFLISGNGNAPSFSGYTTDEEISWDN